MPAISTNTCKVRFLRRRNSPWHHSSSPLDPRGFYTHANSINIFFGDREESKRVKRRACRREPYPQFQKHNCTQGQVLSRNLLRRSSFYAGFKVAASLFLSPAMKGQGEDDAAAWTLCRRVPNSPTAGATCEGHGSAAGPASRSPTHAASSPPKPTSQGAQRVGALRPQQELESRSLSPPYTHSHPAPQAFAEGRAIRIDS